MAKRKQLSLSASLGTSPARSKSWYETLFKRVYFDYFYVGGPRGVFSEEEVARRAEAQVDFVVNTLELAEGARVLDLCCGWGRHAVRLAQRGYRVTGLDLSAYHLRRARAAARKAGVEVEWVNADMREVPGRARYDAVINMFTSFGYFETEAEDQRVLDRVARSLRPGGRFLIGTQNHDGLIRVFRESECRERPDGTLSIELRSYDVLTGRVNVDLIHVEPNGKRRRAFHSLRLYTFSELAAMLNKAGLRVARTWGNFDGMKFSMHSPQMVVLAKKE